MSFTDQKPHVGAPRDALGRLPGRELSLSNVRAHLPLDLHERSGEQVLRQPAGLLSLRRIRRARALEGALRRGVPPAFLVVPRRPSAIRPGEPRAGDMVKLGRNREIYHMIARENVSWHPLSEIGLRTLGDRQVGLNV